MKKLILIPLLIFSAITSADDSKYTIINAYDTTDIAAIYVLNTETGSLKYCQYAVAAAKVICTKWFENED